MVHRLRHLLHADHDDALRHRLPVPERHRHLGRHHPHRLGLRHRQLRLVDRHRPRRHPDLRHSSFAAPVVAQLHQPFRRGHDAIRRGLRRNFSRHSRRPPLAGLLALPLSQHHGRVAAIPQPAHVGRIRRFHLRHHLRAVLVHGADPRFRHPARPHRQSRRSRMVYGMLSMGWRGSARHWHRYETAVSAAGGAGHSAGAFRPHRRELRLRHRHRPRMAHHHLPALLRRRRYLLRLRHGADARHPHPQNLRPRRFHHRRATCRTPPKSCSRPD